MILSLLFTLIIVRSQGTNDCLQFSCSTQFKDNNTDSKVQKNNQPCFSSKENKFTINNSSSCSVLFSDIISLKGKWKSSEINSYYKESSNIHENKKRKRYNGEDCEKNSECYSYLCSYSICKGLQINEDCSDIQRQFCDIGLSCVYMKCQRSKVLNEMCDFSVECDYNSFCRFNKCVKLTNLSIGEYSTKTGVKTIDIQCSSFLKDENGFCIESQNSPLEIKSCLIAFININGSSENQKQCLTNQQCPLFQQDPNHEDNYYQSGGLKIQTIEYLTKLKDRILLNNKLCPKSFKLSTKCLLIQSDIQRYLDLQALYPIAYQIIQFPYCLKQALKYKNLLNLVLGLANDNTEEEKSEGTEYEEGDYQDGNEVTLLMVMKYIVSIAIAVIIFWIFVYKYKPKNKENISQIIEQKEDSSEFEQLPSNSQRQKIYATSLNSNQIGYESSPNSLLSMELVPSQKQSPKQSSTNSQQSKEKGSKENQDFNQLKDEDFDEQEEVEEEEQQQGSKDEE